MIQCVPCNVPPIYSDTGFWENAIDNGNGETTVTSHGIEVELDPDDALCLLLFLLLLLLTLRNNDVIVMRQQLANVVWLGWGSRPVGLVPIRHYVH